MKKALIRTITILTVVFAICTRAEVQKERPHVDVYLIKEKAPHAGEVKVTGVKIQVHDEEGINSKKYDYRLVPDKKGFMSAIEVRNEKGVIDTVERKRIMEILRKQKN